MNCQGEPCRLRLDGVGGRLKSIREARELCPAKIFTKLGTVTLPQGITTSSITHTPPCKKGQELTLLPRYRLKLSFHRLLLELKPLLGEKLQASVYHLRIIEDPPVLRDLLQGLIYAQGQSLRLARGHDVNKVGHS
jgi:hypothetical protein